MLYFFVYILLSQDNKHWYIGSSSNPEIRLKKHNSDSSRSTKPYRPWKIVYKEKFFTRSEAVKREMFLKSPKGYQEYLEIKDRIMIGGFA